MTSYINNLPLLILNVHKPKKLYNHGFTLVETMVVVAMIAILSSVALPNLIKARDKATAGALIGTMASFAKACGANMASELDTALGIPDTIEQTNVCDNQNDVTFKNKNVFTTPANLKGVRCGSDAKAQNDGTQSTCTLTVIKETAAISGKWS